ncbi:MAG: hypothetical protein ACTSW4_01695 [Candidatus Ranarchaeia archaeon]
MKNVGNNKKTACPICNNTAIGDSIFCIRHERAFRHILKSFPNWQEAVPNLSWTEYLELLAKAPGTGEWVFQTVEYLKLHPDKEKHFFGKE